MKTRVTLRRTLLPFLCALTFALPAEAGQASASAVTAWGPAPSGRGPAALQVPSEGVRPAGGPALSLAPPGPVDLDAAISEALGSDAALRSA